MVMERSQPEDVITDEQLEQVETYIDRLYANLDLDVKFSKHFRDRVRDERNKKPITAAELIRLFKQVYKRHGKKITNLTDDVEMVLRDMKTDINVPVAINIDDDGEPHMMANKTIMRKDDFKTSNPILTVENSMADPKKILEHLTASRDQKIEEAMNGDTVSRKFFTMIEDTVSDFEAADGQLSDEERARLVAVFLNGQAKKFLGDSKSIWPLACQKLVEICGSRGGGSTPTPQEEAEPQQQMGGFQPPRPGNPFHMESENVRYLGLTEGLTHKIAENIIREMAASVGPDFPKENDIKFFDPNGNRVDPREMPPGHKKVFKAAIKYLKDNPNTTQRLSTKHHKFNMQVTGDGNVALIDDEGEKLTVLKAGKDLEV